MINVNDELLTFHFYIFGFWKFITRPITNLHVIQNCVMTHVLKTVAACIIPQRCFVQIVPEKFSQIVSHNHPFRYVKTTRVLYRNTSFHNVSWGRRRRSSSSSKGLRGFEKKKKNVISRITRLEFNDSSERANTRNCRRFQPPSRTDDVLGTLLSTCDDVNCTHSRNSVFIDSGRGII